MSRKISRAIWIAVCTLFLLAPAARAYRASDFHWVPPFLAMEEKPSLTFVLDTSSSMLERAYSDQFDGTREYFGYFDTRSYYNYNAESDKPHFFADNATGQWNGNFLNWAAMLRIDVARKLLSGGKFDDQSDCYELEPLGHEAEGFDFDDTTPRRDLQGRMSHMTPLHGAVIIKARDDEGHMLVPGPEFEERYALRVRGKDEDESGLLHAMRNKARVALFTFEDGGQIQHYMSDDFDGIIAAVNSARPQGGAPLAKTLQSVYEYLRHDGRRDSKTADPFYFPSREQLVPCSRQKVILVSAGESSNDHGVSAGFKNTATIKRPDAEYALRPSGSTYLIDVAYLGHTTDLRPEDGMDGMQNWDFYAVCLAGTPSPLLQDAARHGKFRDINGNNLPDLPAEFDADGDDLPDNFFTAQSGRELEAALTRVLQLDTPGVASGTATAVSTQTRSGEGAAYQAIFFPSAGTNQTPPPWSGEVHAYLVDAQGNLREAIKSDQGEKKTAGRIIEFAGERIYAHTDADGNGLIDEGERNATALDGVDDIVLWSASTWIKELKNAEAITQRSSYASNDKKRYIITFVDINQNMVVDEDNGEIQDFVLSANPEEAKLNSPDYFFNYLTLHESASGTMGLDLTHSVQKKIHDLRKGKHLEFINFQATVAKRQVDFIRGMDVGDAEVEEIPDESRNRTHEGKTWRLGDIVFSSPTVVGKPAENYHLIYNDTTYEKFLKQYLDRRQVVYVGANDGMLHAFNGGFWNARTRTFDKKRDGRTEFELGQELWAYVPYNLLPHLRWLMLPEYGENLHVAYMDLTPRVFDARIFVMSDGVTSVDEARYPGGWGTILVAGMRMGGAAMEVDIDKTDGDTFKEGFDRTVSSAYVIMDVTDPESPPNVLAEISLPGQGFTTCIPAVMPMSSPNAKNADENKWYLVFGSGPADAAGRADRSKLMRESSDQPGKLFVLDLSALYVEKTVKTIDSTGLASSEGDAFAFAETGSFISGPVCVDLDIPSKSGVGKFSTDLVYFGTVAGDSASPAGKVYRLRTGNGPPKDWQLSTLIDVAEPVSAAPSVAVDEKGSLWVYFGTGRFFNPDDILQPGPMGFYGIREPETNGAKNWDTVFASHLFDSSKVAVTQGTCGEGEFSDNCVGIIHTEESSNATRDWAWLTSTLDQAPGWKLAFTTAGERVLGQATVLGGSAVFTSVIPAQEVCAAGGTSRLWSLYYKTGTPYFWPSLEHSAGNFPVFIELGQGLGAHPTVHVGVNPITKAISQSSTGDLTSAEITSPLPFKSGCLFWRKNAD
jgi:type IV pilus assembly protein PilY1